MRIGVGAQLLSYGRARDGGLGTYLRGILRALPRAAAESGHELHMFWGREGPSLIRDLSLDTPAVRHHISRLPLATRPARVPWEQFVLPVVVRRAGMDVFHFLDHIVSAAPPAPTTIVTICDAIPVRMPATFGMLRGRYKQAMACRATRRATGIITISEASRLDIVQLMGGKPERTQVIYLGVNPVYHPVRDAARLSTVRARYGLPERFLLYVGRLEPRKNLDRTLRAYSIARERHGLTLPLVLAGKPSWMYEETLQLPAKLGISDHVKIVTEFIPDDQLAAVYTQADALVFTTLFEGFGLPVLEAMACGTPVLASNVSALPELVGDVGVLVDPLNVEEIAVGMGTVVHDSALRNRLAEDGPQRATQFTWQRAAAQTVEVYEKATRWGT